MAGTWSGPGYGVGPAWGFLGAMTVPMGVFAFRYWQDHPKLKWLMLGLIFVSFVSMVYSGSRGALIACVAWGLFYLRGHIVKFKYIVMIVPIAVMAFVFLPEQYKERYFSSFTASKGDSSKASQVAADSAASRLDGLLDGIAMANNNPIFGYGPSVSQWARGDVSQKHVGLQMHNLYGQVMGDGGYLGFIVFLLLWLTCTRALNTKKLEVDSADRMLQRFVYVKDAILGEIIIMLIYGFAAHSLYSIRWVWIYALTAGLAFSINQYQLELKKIEM